MKAVTYLLILLLLSGSTSALGVVAPILSPEVEVDIDAVESGAYPLAEQEADWLSAALRRRSAPLPSQFSDHEFLSSLCKRELSAEARWSGPFRPPPLYVLMSLQR